MTGANTWISILRCRCHVDDEELSMNTSISYSLDATTSFKILYRGVVRLACKNVDFFESRWWSHWDPNVYSRQSQVEWSSVSVESVTIEWTSVSFAFGAKTLNASYGDPNPLITLILRSDARYWILLLADAHLGSWGDATDRINITALFRPTCRL